MMLDTKSKMPFSAVSWLFQALECSSVSLRAAGRSKVPAASRAAAAAAPRAQAALPGARGAAPKCGSARSPQGTGEGWAGVPGVLCPAWGGAHGPAPLGTRDSPGTPEAPVPMAPLTEAENHTECVIRPLLGWMQETSFIEQSWMDTSESYHHKIIKAEKRPQTSPSATNNNMLTTKPYPQLSHLHNTSKDSDPTLSLSNLF